MARGISDETLEIMRFIKQLEQEEPHVTQRHIFYRCVDQGFIEKSAAGEDKVGAVIFHMRWGVSRTCLRGNRHSHLPEPTIPKKLRLLNWQWIADSTRGAKWTETYDGPAHALNYLADSYRRSVLDAADVHVEVYSEKDALTPILWPVCCEYDVPLSSTKGQDSHPPKHALYQRIKEAMHQDKRAVLLVLTDYDPSGQVIADNFETVLTDFCRLDIEDVSAFLRSLTIERVALTRKQVDKYKLPTRPTKRGSNPHALRFEDDRSVELDALSPNLLRDMVRKAIERHIPQSRVTKVRKAEGREQKQLLKLAATFPG